MRALTINELSCSFKKSSEAEKLTLRVKRQTFYVIFSITCVLLAIAFNSSIVRADAAGKNAVNGFQEASAEFSKLSSVESVSRQSWINLANKFLSISRLSNGKESAISLFFAGRAFVRSYKAHGDVKDIDDAIRAFNGFKKFRLVTPYNKLALVELKDAHLMKRKVKSRPANPEKSKVSVSKPIKQQAESAYGNLQRNDVAPPLAKDFPNPQVTAVNKSDGPKLEPVQHRPVATRFGNPFYNGASLQNKPKPQEGIKVASIPPSVVTDTKPSMAALSSKTAKRVIVIDPGHGGRDPGAVSKDGSLTEKEVTLRIAKKLKSHLEKSVPDLIVKLTREDDTFLSLKERTSIANEANADLFVSIHCNGSDYASAAGVETFFLSQASSRGAMRAAARENGISLAKMNHLEATLIDLMMTSKKTESEKLAEIVHESLADDGNQKTKKARDRGIKQAPFYVLMGAAMPSILVECAFISNMSDKNNLTNEKYITSIADRIAKGTKKYMAELGQSS